MSLTVLSVAYPLAPVSLDTVGGAEQVLARIDLALTEAGHHSVVVAREDSATAGDLVPVTRFDQKVDETVKVQAQQETRAAISAALKRWDVDLVHLHGVDFYKYLPEAEIPTLVTLHLPPDWYPPDVLASQRPRTYLHCVSRFQQERCPENATMLPPIENGVSLHDFEFAETKRGYALALGRVCPEKGFHIALDAARAAGVPLYIGGEVYPYEAHQRYFDSEIEPRLDAERQFLGRLGRERKRDLLRSARCLLIPSLVAETSSLVAMEALACGTPVIAFPSGALADIVQHGVTGFLVNDAVQMAAAIDRISELAPYECRRAAEQRFSIDRMLSRYIDTYEQISRSTSTAVGASGWRAKLHNDISSLEPAWRNLYERCPRATPFSSPDWLIPWCEHLAGSATPLAIGVYRQNELAALAPLTTTDGSVAMMGGGVTDYTDLLALDDDAARALWQAIEDQPCREFDLRGLRDLTVSQLPDHRRSDLQEDCICPAIDLGNLRLPAKLLKNLRSQLRQLEKTAQVQFDLVDAGTLPEFIEALFRLHSSRWEDRDEAGVLASPQVREFHTAAIRRLHAAGSLRMHGLRAAGELKAVLYCLTRAGTAYYYLGGFDPALSTYGPGSLLLFEALEFARRNGDHTFDMLRGAERYKYRWGAHNRNSYRLRFGKSSLRESPRADEVA